MTSKLIISSETRRRLLTFVSLTAFVSLLAGCASGPQTPEAQNPGAAARIKMVKEQQAKQGKP